MGLYPHHWSSVVSDHPSQYGYDSVRGRIRLVPGNSFTLERVYNGFVPMWPGLEDAASKESVGSLLVGDLAKASQLFGKMGRGTYWIGKGLGATAQLMSVAEAEGKTKMRDDLLAQLKDRLESWFDGRHSTYFAQDSRLGTFVGVPEEYDSIKAMNDHHFHYGYWVMGAAHVALRDPDWASSEKWGGMVGKIIADIATDERGRTDFPFLRNFDVYEGHSWASGDANFDAGNNQESSSEAVNAWAGLLLWGEATGNRRLRDLGVFLSFERDRVRTAVLVRPRPPGARAGVRQAVRQHGVRRQVRLQHLVDPGAAPDLRHQPAADHDGIDVPRARTRSTSATWSPHCRRRSRPTRRAA